MAGNGSRASQRTIPVGNSGDSIEESPRITSYKYSPIGTSVDGIRLLILEPTGLPLVWTNLIKCRLVHVTFAQKPKYEALSYTWGDETIQHPITIDGNHFTVAQNLFNALKYLRHPSEERVLWVDAICINQTDFSEKNRQIGFMPFIYMRAKRVLIWLGVVSMPLQHGSDGKVVRVDGSTSFEPAQDEDNALLRTLCENPYWRRVWIIQEVGLARKILVHYDTVSREWPALIKSFRSNPETRDSLPVKLQKQIDEKYENGHRLQNLIENHRNSLCKEPRDYVYGFVGLAVDCQEGFPMDYGKSLYEVWKDVVRFKNASQPEDFQYTLPDIDIISFGKVVRDLLGGPGIAAAEDVDRDISRPTRVRGLAFTDAESEIFPEHEEILIPVRVSGRIVHLGPTYQEMMSNLRALSAWRASINRYLSPYEQPSAREESDLFLELLEDVEDEDLKIVESFDRDISVSKPQTPDCLLMADRNCRNFEKMESKTTIDPEPASTNPRLFLLGGIPDAGESSSGKVGLAPSRTRVGDYICLIHGTQKAVVVRKEEGKVRVIGTAVAAENRHIARAAKNEDARREKIFGTAKLKFIDSSSRLDLFVDIATAYQLMG
jgi:hypothetical protein